MGEDAFRMRMLVQEEGLGQVINFAKALDKDLEDRGEMIPFSAVEAMVNALRDLQEDMDKLVEDYLVYEQTGMFP